MYNKFKKILLLTALLVVSGIVSAGLNDGLMAYYPFNGNANDASGNGNNGTLHGGIGLTQDHNGKSNKAYYFDGVDDYISVPDTPSLHPYDQLTISFWVRADKNDTFYPIIYKGGIEDGCNGNYNREYAAWVQPFWWGTGGIEFNAGGGVDCVTYTSTSLITTGRWYFFTGVVDLQNHVMNVYLDGAFQATTPDLADVFKTNSYELRIGQSEEASSSFNGVVDEIRLYDRALSPTEIQQLYSISLPVSGTTLGFGSVSVTCENETTGKSVKMPNTIIEWNCEKAGLVIRPGDRVEITTKGRAGR